MLALMIIAPAAPAIALESEGPASPTRELVVGTHEAPPFVVRGPDGKWHGLAIDLWQDVATDLDVSYRIEATDLEGMVSGLDDGRFDLTVGALTVTPEREERIDFTHPYLTTGFGIAEHKAPAGWYVLLSGVMSWGFLQAILALAGLLLLVGVLFWVAERRHNADEFGGKPAAGIGSGFWFSAVTMTTVGYGDKAPRTAMGKAIALVWMFAAIIIISTFTGMIASALTEGRLSGKVRGIGDLPKVSVGSVGGSAAEGWLAAEGVGMRDFDSVDAGLAALRAGDVDVFVYDLPLLAARMKAKGNDGLRLVPGRFGHQDYAFALPEGSAMREALNVALLRSIEGQAWTKKVQTVLGRE